MSSFNPFVRIAFLLSFSVLFLSLKTSFSQCNNAGMESGNFTGWTGTWEDTDSECNGGTLFGLCLGTSGPNPFHYVGLNQGTNNQAANATPEKNHFIMTGGNDPIAGAGIPVVYPGGGTYSMRLGNAQAEDGGESVSYSFLVTSSNVNFTYHYAVVLGGGTHGAGEQAFFQIRMTDGSGNAIACATYDVDATTSASIGGFVTVGGNMYKPWTSVFIPLYNYIGQTVTIQFITRDCFASGGSHFAYAYLDATCAPLEIISSSPTVCGGQTETLTAPAGAGTYTWTGPGIVAPTGNQQIASINLAGAYSVTMTTLGNAPCSFTLDTIIDPAASNPTANFTYAPVCVGNPVQFTDVSTPTGGITNWAWDFDADGNPDAMTQNPSHTFPSSGTYPVRLLVVATPCADDTIINVDVLSTPTSTFTVTTPHCVGETSTITYTGNAPANATYTWSFDGGTVVSGTGQGPYQVSWATGGSKNVSLTVSLGSCSSPATTVPVVINALPTVAAGADVFICTGESATLTATGATTYDWTPVTGLSATTGASVTATPATTTTYTITGTSNGCVGTGTVTVNVNPFPVVGVNPTTATVCAGTSTTFTANGATTYAWSPSTGLSATTGTSVDATPLTTTTYTVTGTTNGCSTDATFDITVNIAPTVIVSPAVALCGGQTTTLLANGATTYAWSPAVGLSATTGGSVDATPSVTTTYTVVGTALGCTNTQTIDITVTPYPIVSISPAASAICEGDSKGFTASGATTYLWSPATGLSTTTGATVTADPIITTTYQVIGSTNGCNDTALTVLTVNPIPVTTISPDVTICSGQSTPLGASGASSYTWTPATGLNQTTGAYVTANPTATTTYTVVGSTLGCIDDATSTITVHPNPVVDFTVDDPSGCVPHCVVFANATTIANGSNTYTWDFGNGESTNGMNQAYCYADTGTYTVTLTATSNNNCLTTLQQVDYISAYPNPVARFTADPKSASVLSPKFQFTDNSSGATEWYWSFGDGTTVQNLVTTPAHVYPTTIDSGTYTVNLEVINQYGCVDETTLDVYITPHISLYIPNAFSPNEDNHNNTFRAYGENIEEFQMWIFNRWGQEIFYTAVMENGWDGTYKGKQVENDVYVYRIIYRDIEGTEGNPSGSVTLFR